MANQTKSNRNTTAQRSTQSVTDSAYAYARQAAETAVDVPVGSALRVADRVTELVEPWRSRETAERELKSLRQQFSREVNKMERRGGTARRRALQRVRRVRNRVERQVRQRRRRVETAVRQNRRRVEQRLRSVTSRVGEQPTASA